MFALENSTTQSHFQREKVPFKSLEKSEAIFICTHGFYIVAFTHKKENRERPGYIAFLGLCKFL